MKNEERIKCNDGNYAECCSYGMHSAKDIVMQLLIDHDVPSLGHRENCLNNEYSKIGVSKYLFIADSLTTKDTKT